MANTPDNRKAQAALDKHLKTVNAITDGEKEQLKVVKSLAKAMGETVKDVEALLKVRAKTRSLEEDMESLLKSEALSQDESVKILEKALVMKQKEIARQKELNATFDKFREGWDDFWAIAQDPKVATGLFLAAAADKAKELGDNLMDAQKAMGLSYTQAIKMTGTLTSAVGSGMMLGIGFKDAAESAGALAEVMGDLSEITSDAIVSVARLGKKYGIAGSEAAGLYKQIKLMSGGTDAMAESQLKHAENLARANNVAPGKVIEDMAKNSEFMAKFMGKNSKSMAQTAVQAAKLGVEMSDIASMMDSILDIESSIEKEMQVSVLLGRQISFDKARQLVMAGDTLGATKAILQQVGGIAEFEKMSVIQRKALAEAAGVDLATMQSIVGNREKQIEMGLVQASSYEETLGYVKGIYDTGKNNIGVLTTALNMGASLAQMNMLGWVKEKAMAAWRWITGRKEHAQTMIEKKLQQGTGGGQLTKAGKPDMRFKDNKGGVSDMGVGKLGKNMGNILKGAAAMVLVAGAVLLFGKALQEFSNVGAGEVVMAVVGLAAMTGALMAFGMLMSTGAGGFMLAGAAAMILIAASVYILGKALQEMATGFAMMEPMSNQLGALILLTPGMFKAAAGFVAMGYGLIALSAGLLLLAPLLPVIMALGGLASVGMNLMGGGESSDDGSNVIADKLDILIGLIAQGGVVKMDGQKVGEVIALARGPMGT